MQADYLKIFGSDDSYADEPIKRIKSTMSFKTLNALKAYVMNELEHPLRENATNTVFGSGNIHSPVMFIGEAPGAEEDEQGLPFVGKSGQLLTLMMKSIGLKREDVYITNLVPWRPPLNRNPSPEEIQFFVPFLKEHIKLINPKVIVMLGSIATQALFGKTTKISDMRGRISNLLIEKNAYQTLATFHPSYLLRSPYQKKLAWEDMLRLKKMISVQ